MGDEWSSLRASISQGIPSQLPVHPGVDDSVDHAPDRRQVLNSREKKLALKNALRYFSQEHHEVLAPEFLEDSCSSTSTEEEEVPLPERRDAELPTASAH